LLVDTLRMCSPFTYEYTYVIVPTALWPWVRIKL